MPGLVLKAETHYTDMHSFISRLASYVTTLWRRRWQHVLNEYLSTVLLQHIDFQCADIYHFLINLNLLYLWQIIQLCKTHKLRTQDLT